MDSGFVTAVLSLFLCFIFSKLVIVFNNCDGSCVLLMLLDGILEVWF